MADATYRIVMLAAATFASCSMAPVAGLAAQLAAPPCEPGPTDCWGEGMGTLFLVAVMPFSFYGIASGAWTWTRAHARSYGPISRNLRRGLVVATWGLGLPTVYLGGYFLAGRPDWWPLDDLLAPLGAWAAFGSWVLLLVVFSGAGLRRRSSTRPVSA